MCHYAHTQWSAKPIFEIYWALVPIFVTNIILLWILIFSYRADKMKVHRWWGRQTDEWGDRRHHPTTTPFRPQSWVVRIIETDQTISQRIQSYQSWELLISILNCKQCFKGSFRIYSGNMNVLFLSQLPQHLSTQWHQWS